MSAREVLTTSHFFVNASLAFSKLRLGVPAAAQDLVGMMVHLPVRPK
jgi:hypothetical protein